MADDVATTACGWNTGGCGSNADPRGRGTVVAELQASAWWANLGPHGRLLPGTEEIAQTIMQASDAGDAAAIAPDPGRESAAGICVGWVIVRVGALPRTGARLSVRPESAQPRPLASAEDRSHA